MKHNDLLRVRKQPISALYFEFETVLESGFLMLQLMITVGLQVYTYFFIISALNIDCAYEHTHFMFVAKFRNNFTH